MREKKRSITIPRYLISMQSAEPSDVLEIRYREHFPSPARNVFRWHRAGRHLRSLATPEKIRWPLDETRRVLGTHTRARESRRGARAPENGRVKNEGRGRGRVTVRRAGSSGRSAEGSGGGNAGRRGRGREEAAGGSEQRGAPSRREATVRTRRGIASHTGPSAGTGPRQRPQ